MHKDKLSANVYSKRFSPACINTLLGAVFIMRVLCINSSLIVGFKNIDLHLIKEGETYTVYGKNHLGNYDIGLTDSQHSKTYWAKERFLPCMEEEEDVNVFENEECLVSH